MSRGCGQKAGLALTCDAEGNLLEVLYDDLGLASDLVPGRSWLQIIDRDSLGKALDFLAELRARGAVFGWELNAACPGETTMLLFTGAVADERLLIAGTRRDQGFCLLCKDLMRINNEQSNALRATLKEQSLVVRDRSRQEDGLYDELSRLNNELVTLQRELAGKNVELQKLNEQKNRFLGMAAHDLRNPLGIILAYCDFLLDEAADVLGAQHLGFLTSIRSSAQFMHRLVDDLLDVSTIESGKLWLDWQQVDLNALVAHTVALNQVLAERKGIALDLEPEPELPLVIVDPAKIDQVLNNLISNAVKFSPPGSRVIVGLAAGEGHAELWVQDEGPGIPEEERAKLFEPFGRTSVRSTAGEKSSGLGLAIAHRIVESHGGRIRVESGVGRGTTFRVWLPLEPDLERLGL